MCTISGDRGGRLRVAQAYIALLSIPESGYRAEDHPGRKIGKYEIRMSNGSPVRFGDGSPVWIELFDHDALVSVDSCSCREIEDALAAFDHLVAQAQEPE